MKDKKNNNVKAEVSSMCFFKWTSEKPKFDTDCLVICANQWRNDEWEYDLYIIEKTEGENEAGEQGWYWGWFTSDGDEYDDLTDMSSDAYFVMPLLSGSKKQFN